MIPHLLDLATPGGITVALLPEIVLSGWALVVLLVVAWRHHSSDDSRLAGWLSLVGLGLSAIALILLWAAGPTPAGLPQMVALDTFRYAGDAIFIGSAAVTVLVSLRYLEREQLWAPEYYPLVLLATAGMMFLGGSEDLIVLFLGLEVMSVAVYVLSGFDRRSSFSAEAALKYFLIGAFASGFLLYGIALTYGATGATNFLLVGAQLAGDRLTLLASLGLAMLLIGLGFKIAAVPFHMWAPDVYDGAPTPVTGFMATGVKAAAFLALTRLLMEAFPSAVSLWQPVVAILAILTMVVGNLIALAQRSLKRLLAYSSVAHAGYLLVAVWPGTKLGAGAVLMYLVAYGVTTLAAFAILTAMGRGGEREVTLDSIAGLAVRRPVLAGGMALCMLSLLGFPGTFGFIGKWYIISSVVAEGQWILPVVLVITSVISAGYYLPVIMAMYMRPAPAEESYGTVVLPRAAAFITAVCVVSILVFGFWPSAAVNAASHSSAPLGATGVAVAGR
ncbi:MAG TPA: NADH-quinone oxidoreductase subunit N [Gemmatimonadales bacterium]|nr:NADH-quinone oxidoreductase subunit N [Gemmatimonadales bacterium]